MRGSFCVSQYRVFKRDVSEGELRTWERVFAAVWEMGEGTLGRRMEGIGKESSKGKGRGWETLF